MHTNLLNDALFSGDFPAHKSETDSNSKNFIYFYRSISIIAHRRCCYCYCYSCCFSKSSLTHCSLNI